MNGLKHDMHQLCMAAREEEAKLAKRRRTEAPTRVVDWRYEEWDVYIGRPSGGAPQFDMKGEPVTDFSWANEFKVKQHGERFPRHGQYFERVDSIRYFREGLRGKRALVERARRELYGKRLGCWCRGEACHGHVWKELIEMSPNDLEAFFATEAEQPPPPRLLPRSLRP